MKPYISNSTSCGNHLKSKIQVYKLQKKSSWQFPTQRIHLRVSLFIKPREIRGIPKFSQSPEALMVFHPNKNALMIGRLTNQKDATPKKLGALLQFKFQSQYVSGCFLCCC